MLSWRAVEVVHDAAHVNMSGHHLLACLDSLEPAISENHLKVSNELCEEQVHSLPIAVKQCCCVVLGSMDSHFAWITLLGHRFGSFQLGAFLGISLYIC